MALWLESLFGRAPVARPGLGRLGRRSTVWALQCCVALGFLATGVGRSQNPPPATPPTTEESLAAQHRSVFIDDATVGKDPFFPISKRRVGQVPTPPRVVVATPTPVSNEPPWERFQLKGISISTGRRLAILNNYTLAEGEERDYKIDNQVHNVRCVTVHEQSVVISIKGRTKELSLREGL